MSEMIERVAKALSDKALTLNSVEHISWDEMARAAIEAVNPEMDDLREEVETLRAMSYERSRFFDAIVWALGMAREGFRERQEGQGAYWWRSELRRRAFPNGLGFATQHWKDREAGVPEPDWVRD